MVPPIRGRLAASIVALAGTPDAAAVPDLLAGIARLAADTVAGVSCASITTLSGEEYTTVAAGRGAQVCAMTQSSAGAG